MPNKQNIRISDWGGINKFDRPGELFQKAYNGNVQVLPLDSPDLLNMDFVQSGIKKRTGSERLAKDPSQATIFTSACIRYVRWHDVVNNVVTDLVVTTTEIGVKDASGDWIKLKKADGNAHLHTTTFSCTTIALDGHLFIGLGGFNHIQVYRAGEALDDPLSSTGNLAISVAKNSVINRQDNNPATATAGDRYLVGTSGGGGFEEYSNKIVTFISGSPFVPANWDSETASDGWTVLNVATNKGLRFNGSTWDTVNIYIEALTNDYPNGVLSHTITGVWEQGTYLLANFHGRLIYSKGNTVVEATPAPSTDTGVWDRASSGSTFFTTNYEVVSLETFVPKYDNSLAEVLYIGTGQGMQIRTGLNFTTDPLIKIEGSEAPLNHKLHCKSHNWYIYMTEQKNILAINGSQVLNLGRRFKTYGVATNLDTVESSSYSFGFWDEDVFQAQFYCANVISATPKLAFILDFKNGEPMMGEPLSSVEKRVKCLEWKTAASGWFVDMIASNGGETGLTWAGKIFTVDSTDSDLSDNGGGNGTAISANWKTPPMNMGFVNRTKSWMTLITRFEQRSANDPVTADIHVGRSATAFKSLTLNQKPASPTDTSISQFGKDTGTTDFIYNNTQDIDVPAEELEINFKNAVLAKSFTIVDIIIGFKIGAEYK